MAPVLPLSAASDRGVTPYRLAAFALAPFRRSNRTISRLFSRTAQCRAVVPSVSAALIFEVSLTRLRTAAISPDLTAEISGASRPAAISAVAQHVRTNERADQRILKIDSAVAVAEPVELCAELLGDADPEVRNGSFRRRQNMAMTVSSAA